MNSFLLARIQKKFARVHIPTLLGMERSHVEEVAVGASFARFRSGDVVEIARVLRIDKGGSGIPHVRFTVTLRDRDGEHQEGQRTLGLEAFRKLFNNSNRHRRSVSRLRGR